MVRPLLAVPRAALRDAAQARALPWHEDPMNADTAFDRNYLRHEVWPLLVRRWPAAAATIARSAAHVAAGQALLDTASNARLREIADGPALRTQALAALSPAEAREVLRHWLRGRGLPLPSTRRLAALGQDVLDAAPGSHPRVAWAGGELRRERDRLYAFAPLPLLPFVAPVRLPGAGGVLDLAGLGRIRVAAGAGRDTLAPGAAGILTAGPRLGGERLRRVPGAARRPVKDWLREAAILPWVRARAVFVRAGDELAAIVLPGVTWVAVEWRAAPGETGIALSWEDAPEPLTWSPVVEREAPFG
jgi:tRNA(Ile)-lysidine synthase